MKILLKIDDPQLMREIVSVLANGKVSAAIPEGGEETPAKRRGRPPKEAAASVASVASVASEASAPEVPVKDFAKLRAELTARALAYQNDGKKDIIKKILAECGIQRLGMIADTDLEKAWGLMDAYDSDAKESLV